MTYVYTVALTCTHTHINKWEGKKYCHETLVSSMVVFSLNPSTLEAGGALEFKAIFVYVVSFQANQVYVVRPCIKKRRKHWVQTS